MYILTRPASEVEYKTFRQRRILDAKNSTPVHARSLNLPQSGSRKTTVSQRLITPAKKSALKAHRQLKQRAVVDSAADKYQLLRWFPLRQLALSVTGVSFGAARHAHEDSSLGHLLVGQWSQSCAGEAKAER